MYTPVCPQLTDCLTPLLLLNLSISMYISGLVLLLFYCSTLGNALVTLFQLFTLDHWYDILRDLIKVVDPITVEIYIILWICIGAFIFRNIFAGIMGIHAMSFFNYNESNLKLTSSSSKIRGQN